MKLKKTSRLEHGLQTICVKVEYLSACMFKGVCVCVRGVNTAAFHTYVLRLESVAEMQLAPTCQTKTICHTVGTK